MHKMSLMRRLERLYCELIRRPRAPEYSSVRDLGIAQVQKARVLIAARLIEQAEKELREIALTIRHLPKLKDNGWR